MKHDQSLVNPYQLRGDLKNCKLHFLGVSAISEGSNM